MKLRKLENKKNKYIEDLGLRAVSVLIAVFAWLFVSMTTNAETTTRITGIPISLDSETSYLKGMGLNISDVSSETVTAEIEGLRYEIGNLTAADFTAEAVIGDITSEGSYDVEVTLTKKNTAINYNIKNFYPKKISIKLDKINEKTFDVTAEAKNISVAEGYILDKPESAVKTVTIKGTETVIEKIDRCVAVAQTTKELSATTSVVAPIVLYDKDNNEIDASGLTLSATEANVSIPVYLKKTVPVKPAFRNVPTGFDTSALKYTQSVNEIEVAGTEEIISKLEELTTTYIDFRTMGIGSEYTMPVEFPSGVKSVDGVSYVTYKFNSEGFTSVTFNITSVKVKGASPDYDVSLITQEVKNVKIIGTSETISKLTVSDIVAEVDLSSATLSAGTQYVPVNIYVPSAGGVAWATGEYTVAVQAAAVNQ